MANYQPITNLEDNMDLRKAIAIDFDGCLGLALKPCPFCKSPNVLYERYAGLAGGERWRCFCANCVAGIDPGWAVDHLTVREMWNRRGTEARPRDELEA